MVLRSSLVLLIIVLLENTERTEPLVSIRTTTEPAAETVENSHRASPGVVTEDGWKLLDNGTYIRVYNPKFNAERGRSVSTSSGGLFSSGISGSHSPSPKRQWVWDKSSNGGRGQWEWSTSTTIEETTSMATTTSGFQGGENDTIDYYRLLLFNTTVTNASNADVDIIYSDCKCNEDIGKQIDPIDGDFCVLLDSPCKMLTGRITPDNRTEILCSYNGEQQVNCEGELAELKQKINALIDRVAQLEEKLRQPPGAESRGLPGLPGRDGLPGRNGFPGLHGRKGDKGSTGPPGGVGACTPQDKGDIGEMGIVCSGPKGDPGFAGQPGRPGIQGIRGFKGDPGFSGLPGRPGTPGSKGSKGERG